MTVNARWIRATLVGLALLALPGVANARDMNSSDMRTRVEDLNIEMATLQTHDFADEAAQEFAQARIEVGDVQGLLSQGEVARAEVVLRRLEARVSMIRSVLDRATVEHLADQRESELLELQNEADTLQLELEAAQQQRRQLQDAVNAIIDAMESNS